MYEDGGMDGQVDDHMDDQICRPVLSAVEREAAESLLGDAWGTPVEVGMAEVVWKRDHVVRLGTRDGRSAILKRPHQHPDSGRLDLEAFGTEFASLEYLAGMPVPVAPRFLGADFNAGILLMEELPAGRSLADSLLLGDRVTATADLVAYATALGSLHGWNIGRTAEFEQARARYRPAADPQPWWLDRSSVSAASSCASPRASGWLRRGSTARSTGSSVRSAAAGTAASSTGTSVPTTCD